MNKIMASVLFLSSLVIFVGCSTKTLSKDDMSRYKNIELGAFIKERFYMHRTAIARLGEDQSFVITPGSTLKYSGYYNYPVFGEVGDLLMRPKRELGMYCEMHGGKFNQLYAYTENVANIAILSGPRTTQKILNTLKLESKELWHHPDYYKTVELLEGTMNTYRFVYSVPSNRQFVNDAIKGYAVGTKDKPFGIFNCVNGAKKEMWSTSLLPIGFRPADPRNSLTAHEVVVAITSQW
ncbi:MAG: hypothetical protein GC149_06585 [Gammaproteobacteria bacterium]|nr:hypothetical protein [Gammaproteobacteria bacterium]